MKNKFLRIRCKKCKKEQIIFEKTTTELKCLSCNSLIAKPSGGKARIINARVIEVLN